jgi:hypothetical protein
MKRLQTQENALKHIHRGVKGLKHAITITMKCWDRTPSLMAFFLGTNMELADADLKHAIEKTRKVNAKKGKKICNVPRTLLDHALVLIQNGGE